MVKKILSAVLAVITVLSASIVTVSAEDKFAYEVDSKFTDVSENDWFYEAVSKCEDIGLIAGYGDGTFGPNDNVTGEQVCLISLRCLVSWWYPDDAPDTIIGSGMSAAFGASVLENAVRQAYVKDLLTLPSGPPPTWEGQGIRLGSFNDYKQDMYREEALSVFYRTYKLADFSESVKKMNDIRGFETVYIENPNIPDYDEIVDWAKSDIYEAYKIGLANGYDATGAFKPKNDITRAEFCQIIYNSGIVEMMHGKRNGAFD